MDKRDSCGLDNMGDDFSSICRVVLRIIGVSLMEHIKNFIGTFVGVFIIALLIAGRENDKTGKRIQEP